MNWRLASLFAVAILAAGTLEAERRRPVRRPPPEVWKPPVGATWQIQFTGALDLGVDAAMYEIDIDVDASTVAALRARGRRVVCYVNAGAWEEWRADASAFPSSIIGKEYEGWPGERWLDIRRIDILAPILRARFDTCKAKGFDAIDPDNVDGYTQDSGFPLTFDDQLRFNRFLAAEAHARGMSIALKNDFAQAGHLADDFDFAVAEDCFRYDECALLGPFLARGKAVFDIEYTDSGVTAEQFCSRANAMNISAILKNRSLDAFRVSCR